MKRVSLTHSSYVCPSVLQAPGVESFTLSRDPVNPGTVGEGELK